MPRVRVETPCVPTEDREKVKSALRHLFPDLRIERDDDRIVGTTESVEHLRELIRNQKIRDTARRQFLAGRSGSTTRVVLSKQAAYMGAVNFAAPSPLGSIEIRIEDEDLDAVVDYVAESTVGLTLRSSGRTGDT